MCKKVAIRCTGGRKQCCVDPKVLMFSYRCDCDKFLPMNQGRVACSSGGKTMRGRAAILLGTSDTLVGIGRGCCTFIKM